MRGLGAAHESFVEASAGLTAGLAATLVAHPLELVKTRLQGEDTETAQKNPLTIAKLTETRMLWNSATVCEFFGPF